MLIVYVLKSLSQPHRHYIGITENLENRVKEHNQGESEYTKKFGPWCVETYITFQNHDKASTFERYLKKGSGHAFLKRYLI